MILPFKASVCTLQKIAAQRLRKTGLLDKSLGNEADQKLVLYPYFTDRQQQNINHESLYSR
jgi:hypothetical protein